jgi:glycine cleavage system H protein
MSSPNDDLKLTVDKFIFRFPKELRYTEAGLWIRQEDNLLRIGMSDFAQQRNGDIAFAALLPAGAMVDTGDEIAAIETVKISISLPSPVKCKVVEINSSLLESPEVINQDPYGKGWIAVIQPENPDWDLNALMTAEAYLALAWQQAETELMS